VNTKAIRYKSSIQRLIKQIHKQNKCFTGFLCYRFAQTEKGRNEADKLAIRPSSEALGSAKDPNIFQGILDALG